MLKKRKITLGSLLPAFLSPQSQHGAPLYCKTCSHTAHTVIVTGGWSSLMTHILEIAAADDQTDADSVAGNFLFPSLLGNPAVPPYPLSPLPLFFSSQFKFVAWTQRSMLLKHWDKGHILYITHTSPSVQLCVQRGPFCLCGSVFQSMVSLWLWVLCENSWSLIHWTNQ